MTSKFLTPRVNARAATQAITNEAHFVGEENGEPNKVWLHEKPQEGSAVTVTEVVPATNMTQIASGSPADGQFLCDYETGELSFHSADDGVEIEVDYTAVGSVLVHRDVNRLYEIAGPWNIDIKPPTVGDCNDEFEGAALDAKWTAVVGTESPINLFGVPTNNAQYEVRPDEGALLIQSRSNAAVQLRQTYTLPDGKSVVAALAIGTAYEVAAIADGDWGISVALNQSDTSPSTGEYLMLRHAGRAGGYRFTAFSDTTSAIANTPTSLVVHGTYYFRIARAGLVYHMFWSRDGAVWQAMNSDTAVAAHTKLWIEFFRVPTETPAPYIALKWVREGGNGVFPW